MWSKADEAFDTVVSAPDSNGNVRVRVTFTPTSTTATKVVAASEVEATKKELTEQVREEAKKITASATGSKGSSATKISG